MNSNQGKQKTSETIIPESIIQPPPLKITNIQISFSHLLLPSINKQLNIYSVSDSDSFEKKKKTINQIVKRSHCSLYFIFSKQKLIYTCRRVERKRQQKTFYLYFFFILFHVMLLYRVPKGIYTMPPPPLRN